MDPYATHLPLLVSALWTYLDGPVLEVGTGHYSTPIIDVHTKMVGRGHFKTDCDPKWAVDGVLLEGDPERVLSICKWWGIVFVDSGIASSRKEWIRAAADRANVIIFHDADDRYDYLYGYSQVRPLFKHRFRYDKLHPATEIVSNYQSLEELNFLR